MKILRYLDFILEAKESIQLPMVISDSFEDKIERIDSVISDKFKHIKLYKSLSDYSLLNTGKSDDTIEYIDSTRLFKYLNDRYTDSTGFSPERHLRLHYYNPTDEIWKKSRTEIKIGRFIKKLFGDEFKDSEIEIFVNKWKSLDGNDRFEIWKGSEIKNGYSSNKYVSSKSSSPLMNSCMNDQLDLIEFYEYSPSVKLLVLLDEDDHISARALVWTDHKNRIIMDRVYYSFDRDYHKFVGYAESNGWYYKMKNISGSSHFIRNEEELNIKTKVKVTDVFNYARENGNSFPYMDTFNYAQGGWCMNYTPTDGEYFKLIGTEGDYESYYNSYDVYGQEIENEDDYIYSQEQGGLIYQDNSTRVRYNGGSGFEQYSFDDWINNRYLEDPKNGFIKIDDNWYKEKHCVWSDKENKFIWRPKAIFNNGDWVSWDNFHIVKK